MGALILLLIILKTIRLHLLNMFVYFISNLHARYNGCIKQTSAQIRRAVIGQKNACSPWIPMQISQ
jgi:hypothetical protein